MRRYDFGGGEVMRKTMDQNHLGPPALKRCVCPGQEQHAQGYLWWVVRGFAHFFYKQGHPVTGKDLRSVEELTGTPRGDAANLPGKTS